MKNNVLIFITILLFFNSCSSYKHKLYKGNDKDKAILNSILIFTHSSNLYEKADVFKLSLLEIDNIDNLFVVRIGIYKNKMVLDELNNAKEQYDNTKMASRYLIDGKNKLFLWWDEKHEIYQSTVDVFKKYNLLVSDINEYFDNWKIDDSKKSAHIYFCKNDITKFKKVQTNKGIGYYKTPRLQCD